MSGEFNMNAVYFVTGTTVRKNTKEGPVALTNFTAKITEQLIFHDGDKVDTVLVIDGELSSDGKIIHLAQTQIPATELRAMSWVPKAWGMMPIIYSAPNAANDFAIYMQWASRPITRDIYTHIGWATINGKATYLANNGGLSAEGLDTGITVRLPQELSRYSLVQPTFDASDMVESIKLINLGPKWITWPAFLATYRAAIMPSDFAIHLAGRTGTFKSEISSLFQSHYGPGMDARHLPASWNATANAIEALAYRAKDAIMVLDDFVPVGTSWQVRQLTSKADQVIRAQGNQSGRARLSDTTSMQQTMYPRGIIWSTGEDIPEGHSIRGRMMILELSPGDIPPAKLSEAQANRSRFVSAMSSWIAWLARHPEIREQVTHASHLWRDKANGIGHTRTPSIVGDLMATWMALETYFTEMKWFPPELLLDLRQKAEAAVFMAANKQTQHLESSDPVTAFIETIKSMMQAQNGHMKTKNGGVPERPERYGWEVIQTPGGMPDYKSHGNKIGWVAPEDGEMYVDPMSLTLLKKWSGGRLSITPQTLMKRIKEAGLLTRRDEARERNTIRITLEGSAHQVMALDLFQVFPKNEEREREPGDEEE